MVARAVDEEVRRGERDRGAERGGGLPHPVQARVDQGEELARRRRECVVVEDGRILDRGLEVVDQVVDDLELARRAIVAGEAAKQRFDEVVDEAGEDARGLGGVEVGDFVAPAFAADLFERRLEAAGDEFFVEAWGASRLGRMRGRRGRRFSTRRRGHRLQSRPRRSNRL